MSSCNVFTPEPITTPLNEVQLWNAYCPTSFTLSGIMMDVNDVQALKADFAMVFTLRGMINDSNELQLSNMCGLILSNLDERDTFLNDLQPANAAVPTSVTESDISIVNSGMAC